MLNLKEKILLSKRDLIAAANKENVILTKNMDVPRSINDATAIVVNELLGLPLDAENIFELLNLSKEQAIIKLQTLLYHQYFDENVPESDIEELFKVIKLLYNEIRNNMYAYGLCNISNMDKVENPVAVTIKRGHIKNPTILRRITSKNITMDMLETIKHDGDEQTVLYESELLENLKM